LETPVTRLIGFCASNKLLILSLVAAACLWEAWVMLHLPLDATPDLSETQVIILSRWDRSPDIIEDQVT
jgi:Cu(I)/Ag(I) efflux system membrane protein CusA/SilA